MGAACQWCLLGCRCCVQIQLRARHGGVGVGLGEEKRNIVIGENQAAVLPCVFFMSEFIQKCVKRMGREHILVNERHCDCLIPSTE